MSGDNYGLEDLHFTLLEMALFLDDFCKKNGIKYYLKGGSALGAVRQGCFIPWDDDFDIIMPKEDYDSFIRLMTKFTYNNDYYLQLPDTPENPYYFAKLKKNNTLFIEESNKGLKTHEGIFIDIFCLTNVNDFFPLSYLQFLSAKLMVAKSLTYKNYNPSGIRRKTFFWFAKLIPKLIFDKLLKPFVFGSRKYAKVADFFDRGGYHKCVFDEEVFGSPLYIDFCNKKLPVPAEVNEYLEARFGDYKKLPSESERLNARHSLHYKTNI